MTCKSDGASLYWLTWKPNGELTWQHSNCDDDSSLEESEIISETQSLDSDGLTDNWTNEYTY